MERNRASFGTWGFFFDGKRDADQALLVQRQLWRRRRALRHGSRIFSSYRMPDGEKLWIITEADRSATKFLLPDEY